VHVHQSGCADVRVPDDETAAGLHPARGRAPAQLGARLLPRHAAGRSSRASTPDELTGSAADHREAYDAFEVLARLVDQSLFWEVLPEVGRR
jgi:3-methylcrotonyl-CoA carboxylase beta subunit